MINYFFDIIYFIISTEYTSHLNEFLYTIKQFSSIIAFKQVSNKLINNRSL